MPTSKAVNKLPQFNPPLVDDATVLRALLEECELGCSLGKLYSGVLLKVLLDRNPTDKKQLKDLRQDIRRRKEQFHKLSLGYLP